MKRNTYALLLSLEIRGECETGCQHWHKYSACLCLWWGCRQQWRHRVQFDCSLQSQRSGIFRNTARVWLDSAEETAWRKCLLSINAPPIRPLFDLNTVYKFANPTNQVYYDFHLKKAKKKRYTNICFLSDFLLTFKTKYRVLSTLRKI